ncbi:MAG: hypothetical protein IJN09_01155, partial [Oscillospiraceae bacterium]|nr:hypothetical protein [Oscillospiraceae bacterium]
MNNNLSPEQLLQMARLMQSKGMSEAQQKNALTDFAMKNMDASQSGQLKKVLSDADAVRELLSSEKASQLIQ